MLNSDHVRFFFSWLRAPRAVASAVPSGRGLCGLIASQVPVDEPGLVVELGAGTGAITQALLAHGVTPDRLTVVERNERFAAMLQARYPAVTTLNADAQYLRQALTRGTNTPTVATIVSGLPLLTLPDDVCRRVLSEVRALLYPHGRLLQFTYGRRSPVPMDWVRQSGARATRIGSVWSNLPPAAVWQYAWR